ncbi:MAG: hypothetical protein ABR507_11795 [Actinomycetota bacterium]
MHPRYYLVAFGAGLATASAIGFILIKIRFALSGLLIPVVCGALIGSAVARVTHSVGTTRVRLLAASTAALGLALGMWAAGLPAQLLTQPRNLVGLLVASGFAAFITGR